MVMKRGESCCLEVNEPAHLADHDSTVLLELNWSRPSRCIKCNLAHFCTYYKQVFWAICVILQTDVLRISVSVEMRLGDILLSTQASKQSDNFHRAVITPSQSNRVMTIVQEPSKILTSLSS